MDKRGWMPLRPPPRPPSPLPSGFVGLRRSMGNPSEPFLTTSQGGKGIQTPANEGQLTGQTGMRSPSPPPSTLGELRLRKINGAKACGLVKWLLVSSVPASRLEPPPPRKAGMPSPLRQALATVRRPEQRRRSVPVPWVRRWVRKPSLQTPVFDIRKKMGALGCRTPTHKNVFGSVREVKKNSEIFQSLLGGHEGSTIGGWSPQVFWEWGEGRKAAE